jgi:hypothetical protein
MTGVNANQRDGWGIYLALVVCLLPIIAPAGPGRTAIVDAVIIGGLAVFMAARLSKHERIRVPFFVPVLMISIGSLAAIVNAVSPTASFLAIAQDAYLFLWFVMLVHVLRRRNMTAMRVTWVVVATLIAIGAIGYLMWDAHLSLIDMAKPRGRRAVATFYDPNMFGGYLVMSMFMALSVRQAIGRVAQWAVLAVLAMALIATKSNGALLSLFVGLPVWAIVRARTRRISAAALGAAALLSLTVLLAGVWMSTGFGVGGRTIHRLESQSFLARATRSSEGRFAIWKQLETTYAKSPLGIGPGNSRWLSLSIEQRLRPGSMASREAHNDYLAYAIERGPLAFIGLFLLVFQAIRMVMKASAGGERQRPQGDAMGPLSAALAGALAASLVHALTIEVLHFRHFWMLLAMVCAIEGAPPGDEKATEGTGEMVPAPGVAAA